jgi:hypothetical protein
LIGAVLEKQGSLNLVALRTQKGKAKTYHPTVLYSADVQTLAEILFAKTISGGQARALLLSAVEYELHSEGEQSQVLPFFAQEAEASFQTHCGPLDTVSQLLDF